MGTVHPFKRRRKRPNRSNSRSRRRAWFGYPQAMLATLGISIGALGGIALTQWPADQARAAGAISCSSVEIVDGDTLRCDSVRIRLLGIDAPERPGHCRPGRRCTPGDPFASTANLERIVSAGPLTCRADGEDSYGRTLARCEAAGVDLSCAQLAGGFAIRRYSAISCPDVQPLQDAS